MQDFLSDDEPKSKRCESTHSRFSLSTPPPPLVWACCLISPWSSALLHTSKSTLARSTCYYLLSAVLLCKKQTTNAGQVRSNGIDDVSETHFGLEKNNSPFKLNGCIVLCGSLWLWSWSVISPDTTDRWVKPQGPCEEEPARCWVYASAAECLCVHLISSRRSVGEEWRLDALLPSSLDTRVTQWLG